MLDTLAHLFTPKSSNNHRPKLIQPLGLVLLVSLFLVGNSSLELIKLTSPPGIVLGFASSITSAQVFELTNRERLRNGLPPLTLNKYLSQAAASKAKHMFSTNYWDHIAPDGTTPWMFIKDTGYRYTIAGENLARDFDTTIPMIQAWMDSPTHQANIIHQQYQDTGIAVINGQLDGINTTLVVQMFAAPTTLAPSSLTPSTPLPQISNQATQTTPQEVITFLPQHAQVAAAQSPATLSPSFHFISPLNLKFSLSLAIIFIIVGVIAIDELTVRRRNTIRFVGRNLAHLSFLAFVIIIIFSITVPGGIR